MSLDLKSNFLQNNFKGVKPSVSCVYEFEDFRLDAANLMLYQNGDEISLTPKQVETLLALVEKNGEILSKDALMERLWENAFVEESNLNQNIYILRKILGKTADGKPMIETLRRRGYRFNGELKEKEQAQVEIVSEHQSKEESTLLNLPSDIKDKAVTEKKNAVDSPNKKRAIAALTIVVSLFVTVGFGFYLFSSRTPVVRGKKSIAILPFKPINAANRDEIYESGIADSLILRLNSLKAFVVRPLSAVRKYSDIEQDPIAAGREQQVDYVLASNYQLADGKIRVTAQLFNVASGQIEDTYKGEKEALDLFAMQDSIANEMGNKLLAIFATTSNLPATKRGTANEEAYRLYLQGKNLAVKGGLADAQKGIEYFEQSIQLDPNFARAYSALAYAYIRSGHLGGGLPREEYEKARVAVTKALELDNNLAEGYRVLGELKHAYEWDSAGAEKAWFRAFELEPNSESRYAGYLAESGRFGESVAAIDRMIEADPNSLYLRRERGRILYLARRYDEAIIQLKRVLELDETLDIAWAFLQQAYHMKGDDAGAYESFMKYQKPLDSEDIELYQKVYKTVGWRGVAQKHLELLKLKENQPSGNYYRIARFSALLGEKEKAFEYLNKAIEKRHGQLRMLKVEPNFDILRDDPRFDELLKRIGL
jgi:DNA-binding winged helix-turn-helix (wHTH) protein/TolB-like protein/Tfp pilus assembly protein PilF